MTTHLYSLWYKGLQDLHFQNLLCSVELLPPCKYNVYNEISLTRKSSYSRIVNAINLCFVEDEKITGDYFKNEFENLTHGNLTERYSLCNPQNFKAAIECFVSFGSIRSSVKLYEEPEVFQTSNKTAKKALAISPSCLKINVFFPSLKKLEHVLVSCKVCPLIAFVKVVSGNKYQRNAYNLAKLYVDAVRKKRGHPILLNLLAFLVSRRGAKREWFLDVISDSSFYVNEEAWIYLKNSFPDLFAEAALKESSYLLRVCHPSMAPAVVVTDQRNLENLKEIKNVTFPNSMAKQFMESLYVGGAWVNRLKSSTVFEKCTNSLLLYSTLYDFSIQDTNTYNSGTFDFYVKMKDFHVPNFGVLLPSHKRFKESCSSDVVYSFFPLTTCYLHLHSFQNVLCGFFKLFQHFAKKGALSSFLTPTQDK